MHKLTNLPIHFFFTVKVIYRFVWSLLNILHVLLIIWLFISKIIPFLIIHLLFDINIKRWNYQPYYHTKFNSSCLMNGKQCETKIYRMSKQAARNQFAHKPLLKKLSQPFSLSSVQFYIRLLTNSSSSSNRSNIFAAADRFSPVRRSGNTEPHTLPQRTDKYDNLSSFYYLARARDRPWPIFLQVMAIGRHDSNHVHTANAHTVQTRRAYIYRLTWQRYSKH